MSDTPRTDAFISKFHGARVLSSGSRHRTDVELHDFARQLERELAEQQEQFRCVRWQLLLCRQMGIPYLTSCFVCAGERQILMKECGK
jgi:hypothetical protein